MPEERLYEQLSLLESIELHRAILAATNLAEAHHLSARLLAEHPPLSVGIRLSQPHWRVRPASDPSGFDSVSKLLAPPPENTGPGRANHEGDPKLYISARLETALAEVQAIEGRHYHAIALMSQEDSELRLAVVGEQHNVLRKGYLDNFGYDPEEVIKGSLRRQGAARAERIAFADALMADVLADPEARSKNYIPSRGLADVLVHHTRQSHGIIYPSVRHHLGKNYCLDPAIALRELKVVACMVLRVDRAWPKGYFSTTPTAIYAVDEGGRGKLRPVGLHERGPVWFNLSEREARALDLEQSPGP